MGDPTPTQTGPIPNSPNEAWVPIQNWAMLLVGETPSGWVLSLATGGRQYRFWKADVAAVPPVPEPQIGDVAVFSIPNQAALDAGLIPPPDQPPRAPTLAQQQAQSIADILQAELLQSEEPPPPEGP